MSEDCLFCSIVAGDIPSRTVYEDEDVFAFLDVNPLAPGHTLVIPNDHYAHVQDLPEDLAGRLFATASQLVDPVEAAVDADATTVAFNNGEAAGQEVPHVHGHVVPRFEGDGAGPVHALFTDRPDLSEDELDDIAADISDRVE